jgi:hypothetical protein
MRQRKTYIEDNSHKEHKEREERKGSLSVIHAWILRQDSGQKYFPLFSHCRLPKGSLAFIVNGGIYWCSRYTALNIYTA